MGIIAIFYLILLGGSLMRSDEEREDQNRLKLRLESLEHQNQELRKELDEWKRNRRSETEVKELLDEVRQQRLGAI